ncbi:MAG: DHH family phosphoesterase [Candidatus Eisenbacteria sp.]|nr:DHH family phosphoesterase [Candidatus Eisenbacteria bacterium]
MTKPVTQFLRCIPKGSRVLLLTHPNPDPDAIASAYALRHLIKEKKQAMGTIGYWGVVGRKENATMLDLLGIEMVEIGGVDPGFFDRIVLVDSQPGQVGEPLGDARLDVIIDHHPVKPRNGKTRYEDIRVNYGSTATIVTEYLRASGTSIPPRVSTALLYGIKTDTLLLSREADEADVSAFLHLYPLADLKALRRIERPSFPLEHLDAAARAFRKRRVCGNMMFLNIGRVNNENVIPQVADFYLPAEEIDWIICFGKRGKVVYISVRNDNRRRSAGRAVHHAFSDMGKAGGHRTMAAAILPVDSFRDGHRKSVTLQRIEEVVIGRFLDAAGNSTAE